MFPLLSRFCTGDWTNAATLFYPISLDSLVLIPNTCYVPRVEVYQSRGYCCEFSSLCCSLFVGTPRSHFEAFSILSFRYILSKMQVYFCVVDAANDPQKLITRETWQPFYEITAGDCSNKNLATGVSQASACLLSTKIVDRGKRVWLKEDRVGQIQ